MPNENGTFTPEEVESLKIHLQGEISTRDQQLAELQASLTTLKQTIETSRNEAEVARNEANTLIQAREVATAEIEALKGNLKSAIGKYRSLVIASNPDVPGDLVQGEDIDSLNASLDKARGVVDQVRASIQAQAQASPVPAGAPPRTGPETGALSSTEKIKYALRDR